MLVCWLVAVNCLHVGCPWYVADLLGDEIYSGTRCNHNTAMQAQLVATLSALQHAWPGELVSAGSMHELRPKYAWVLSSMPTLVQDILDTLAHGPAETPARSAGPMQFKVLSISELYSG